MRFRLSAAALCSVLMMGVVFLTADKLVITSYAQDHVHDYSKTVVSEPDCENSGKYYYICSCRDDYYEYPEALGHAESEWITDKKPTASNWGHRYTKCTRCEKTLKEEDLPPTAVDISQCSVKYTSVYTYTGKAITPAVAVSLNGKNLIKGTDYTVEYLNNTDIGTAIILIKGTGGYTGTLSRSFVITGPSVKAPSGFTNTNSSPTVVRLDWNKVSGVSGYKLQKWNSQKKVWETYKIFSADTVRHNQGGLREGTTLKYRIQSYKRIGNRTFYSTWSEIYASTDPGKVTDLRAVSVSESGYTIKWSAVRNADKYIVYRYDAASDSYKKLKTVTGTSLKITDRAAGQRNAYKVQAVKVRSWKTYEGQLVKMKFSSKPSQVKNLKTEVDRRTLKISWSKVTNATGYQVYYNSAKAGNSVLIKEISSGSVTSLTTKALPTGKSYYIKVRAVSKTPDVKIVGKCSEWRKVRVFNDKSYNSVINGYGNSYSVTVTNGQGYSISSGAKNRLYNSLTGLGGTASFLMLDLDSGAMVAYNAKSYLGTASTVKMPYMLYCLKEMEDGSPSMSTKLTYRSSDYSSGSGIIKNYSFGTQFTIKQCMQYIFDYSDNCAYYMLQDYFGYSGYNSYIASLGCRTTMNAYQRWGYVSAADSAKEWIEMYKYIYSGRYADFIRAGLASSTASNFRIGLNGKYTVYSKCGWTDELHHDTAVVEAEHPYILICLTNRVSASRLQEVARAADAIHTEMWNYYNK